MNTKIKLILQRAGYALLTCIAVAGCSKPAEDAATTAPAGEMSTQSASETSTQSGMQTDRDLKSVVASRDADKKSRDQYRHPVETLEFFQVEPGMTVAEALPGGGWYSEILVNYLGPQGTLYGINYADDMWARFGMFDEQTIENFISSTATFPDRVAEFTDSGIKVESFTFATVPQELEGTVDRVLVIRALHNLNRFETEAGTLQQALDAMYRLLKPGGMVGVVQHRLPEDAPEEGADGSRGYLKQSHVVKMFEAVGFTLVDTSEINANPNDKPSDSDIVWRLPPNFNGSQDNPEMRQQMAEIGESDRMTLLFRKE